MDRQAEGDMMLKASKITKVYGKTVKNQVLFDIDLEIKKGEFMSIIGPSGSGKSTLLNIIGALDRPTTGELFIDGKDTTRMDDIELSDFRNRSLGFIFQFHYLLPAFTALENVLMPSWIMSRSPSPRLQERAKELLSMVGLSEKMNSKPSELSGGQQQRVAIARSLINTPPIVLADEPTGNLDTESTSQVYELLRNINKELNTTFIVVTHDRRIASKSDRIVEIVDGRVQKDYPTDAINDEGFWQEVYPIYCKYCKKYEEKCR
ncbi:ABC-type antimicrobial peptide transport system, ATPase component LolD [Peptoclostridium acidaminophilum DSM 3953]|uniref:ABC-type antimicrobial peptide transport system, ATPase component LolD n=1 Tax=Peptoclostridium acidaminophilum DSM 3953 TaxID=1286171 RepID=W8U972_PEPAC|nr:ABC transporter ATP-binding protein [Peptoclostridium acidaminophilum]AHM57406.1 ABC-type antimicrobial peptide transport system, ATPase component LolD [Peptoclostridium acidaminophilum DSM 3953]